MKTNMSFCVPDRLNNRKARLARTKDVRVAPEFNALADKQGGRGLRSKNSPESPGGDASAQLNVRSDPQMKLNTSVVQISGTNMAEAVARGPAEFVPCKQGDSVLLKFNNGEEVGIGKVFQASGQWFGRNLEELRAYVVDIKELKVRRTMKLPYPSMATGGTFEETESKIGIMRVLWDSNRTFKLPPLRLG